MCYYLVIFQRPFKIAQLCSIKARPSLSINAPVFPRAFKRQSTQDLMALRSFLRRKVMLLGLMKFVVF